MLVDSSFVPRKFEREPVRKIAHILVRSEGDPYGAGAYTLDISPRGSRVHTALDLKPGQIIEFQPQDSSYVTRCRVVWKGSAASASEDQAGIEFLESYLAPAED
jgi:PilZ domain